MNITPAATPDMPPAVIEGPKYAETADLPTKDLTALIRADARARLAELKKAGLVASGVRVNARHEWLGSGMHSINLTVTIPQVREGLDWPSDTRVGEILRQQLETLRRELEPLREAYNRETRNTSADHCRYYGGTLIGA